MSDEPTPTVRVHDIGTAVVHWANGRVARDPLDGRHREVVVIAAPALSSVKLARILRELSEEVAGKQKRAKRRASAIEDDE